MITAEYDRKLNVMRFTLRGKISLSMMVGAALAWMKSSNYQPDAPAVWDLRDSDWSQINIEFSHVGKRIVAEINQYRPSNIRVAWLVDTLTESSIIETIYGSEDWRSKWRAFTSEEEAIRWLTEPVTDKAN
jgi:hypothetical protein